jgi:hypothetical protein
LRLLTGQTSLNMSSAMVRRSLPARFPAWTQFAEDAIYAVDVGRYGQIVLVPEVLVGIRIHAKSQSSSLGVQAKWHQTVQEWLNRNPHQLDKPTLESLRHESLSHLCRQTWFALYSGDRQNYEMLRSYLRSFSGHPEVDRLIRSRPWPRWYYAVRHALHQHAVSLIRSVTNAKPCQANRCPREC